MKYAWKPINTHMCRFIGHLWDEPMLASCLLIPGSDQCIKIGSICPSVSATVSASINPLPSDRLHCCDWYIRCQRLLAVKPLNSRSAMGECWTVDFDSHVQHYWCHKPQSHKAWLWLVCVKFVWMNALLMWVIQGNFSLDLILTSLTKQRWNRVTIFDP